MQDTDLQTMVVALRVDAAAIVAHALHAASCGWGVLHGAEEYPESVGRDLDILVDPELVDDLAGRVSSTLASHGWVTSIIRRPWKVTQVIASRDAACGAVAFEVDFIGYQMWRSVLLARGPVKPDQVYFRGGHMACDPWGGFVKRVLIQCLASNWKKVFSRPAELRPYEQELEIVVSRLRGLCGVEVTTEFIGALDSGDAKRVRDATQRVRASVLSQTWKLGGMESQKLRWLHDKAAERFLHQPHTPLIVVVFDSGGEESAEKAKSLIAQRCKDNLVFPSVVVSNEGVNPGPKALFKLRRESAFSNLIILSTLRSDHVLRIIKENNWILPVWLKESGGHMVWTVDGTNEYPLGAESIGTKLLPAIMASCHFLNSGNQPPPAALAVTS